MRNRNSHGGGGFAPRLIAVVVTAASLLCGITAGTASALGGVPSSGVSPRGTTVDLFDYWVDGNHHHATYGTGGINANGHQLQFNTGKSSELQNSWTGGETNKPDGMGDGWGAPRTGMVSTDLVNGYPSLADTTLTGIPNFGDNWNNQQSTSTQLHAESLDYLFNSSSFEGKTAYMDVGGLLQVDDEGYYTYDCRRNFAAFTPDGRESGSFSLYGDPAVGGNGQFFPFADPGTVDIGTSVDTEDLNHHFGMHMSTRFVQQYGGHTDESQQTAVTYNFSGDDDVWVYVDGKLVGDLGGIHDAVSLQINFASGEVVTYRDANGDNVFNAGDHQFGTTEHLSNLVYGDQRPGTLADNSYHTLDFFYLERGAGASNMTLKYNLKNIPESGVLNVDQNGDPIPGSTFILQEADADYQPEGDGLSVKASTNANGELVFTWDQSNAGDPSVADSELPIALDQLYEISGGNRNWILTQTGVPAGYRNAGAMQLYYDNGLLLSNNEWATGAWSQAHVTMLADGTAYPYVGPDGTSTGAPVDLSEGETYAVILKRGTAGGWHPVSGNVLDGWTVADATSDDTGAVLSAARSYGEDHRFVLGSDGSYEVTLDELPGDVNTYYYRLLQNNDPDAAAKAEYTIGVYHVAENGTVTRLQSNPVVGNTTIDGFERMFSVTLNVPNIKNMITVKKTDANGQPLSGATFQLYEGFLNVKPQTAGTPYTTGDNGEVVIGDNDTEHLLVGHDYTIFETEAPEPYLVSETPIHVHVDSTGVYADAGGESDDINVTVGLGGLVKSMNGFSANDRVDATLHDVQAVTQSGVHTTAPSDGMAWTDQEGAAALHLHYDGVNNANAPKYASPTGGLAYAATGGQSADRVTIESGWPRLRVEQCRETHAEGSGTVTNSKQNLEGKDLSALFTGAVTVTMSDEIAGLTVANHVEPYTPDEAFSYTVTFKGDNGASPLTGQAKYRLNDGVWQTLGAGQNVTVTTSGDGTVVTCAFNLSDEQRVQFTGLAANVEFTVTQDKKDGWTTNSTLSDGTIVTQSDNGPYTQTDTLPDRAAGQADFYNTKNGGLTVTKQVKNGDGGESFAFTVLLTYPDHAQPSADQVKVDSQVVDNAKAISFSLKHGQSATITGLPHGTTYQVTETANAAYDTTIDAGSGSIDANLADGNQVTVTNTRKTGTLTVTKTTYGADGNEVTASDLQFEFTVVLSDIPVGATIPEGWTPKEDGTWSRSFQLGAAGNVSFSDLPVGATYTVTETNSGDYQPEIGTVIGSIVASGSTAAFVNSPKPEEPTPTTGSLTVTKHVVHEDGSDPDASEQFMFTVAFSGDIAGISAPEDVQCALVEGGSSCSFVLADDQSRSFSDIPAGVAYTVSEAPVDGYVSSLPDNATGTIGTGTTIAVDVTNTLTAADPDPNPDPDPDPDPEPTPDPDPEPVPTPEPDTPASQESEDNNGKSLPGTGSAVAGVAAVLAALLAAGAVLLALIHRRENRR